MGTEFRVEASPERLCVAGEVDLAVAVELLDAILAAGHAIDGAVLDVDLSGVTFIDSTGIGTLVDAAQRLAADGVTLRVSAASGAVDTIVSISGVAEVIGYQSDR